MKSKPLIHDKNHQLPLTDIGGAWYLTHLAAFFLLIRKHNFLPSRGDWVVVCNLIDAIWSVVFDDVKCVVVYVAWTL